MSLAIMRPLRLTAVSFPVNIIDDFSETLSKSIPPRDFTYPSLKLTPRRHFLGRIILQNFMFKLYLEAEFRHKHIFKIHALSRLCRCFFFFCFCHMIEIWLDILLEDKIVMLMVEPTQTVLLARFLKS